MRVCEEYLVNNNCHSERSEGSVRIRRNPLFRTG